MLNAPNIPTDNIYKFIFYLCGLILILVCIVPDYLTTNLEEKVQHHKNQRALYHLESQKYIYSMKQSINHLELFLNQIDSNNININYDSIGNKNISKDSMLSTFIKFHKTMLKYKDKTKDVNIKNKIDFIIANRDSLYFYGLRLDYLNEQITNNTDYIQTALKKITTITDYSYVLLYTTLAGLLLSFIKWMNIQTINDYYLYLKIKDIESVLKEKNVGIELRESLSNSLLTSLRKKKPIKLKRQDKSDN
ncbi:MAG: hypothetical protein PHN88_14330 [Ignavibacteria bacterium]|nr:hypothetical protein [Ignavibacteria bacterium]